jgi:hypothetical protein
MITTIEDLVEAAFSKQSAIMATSHHTILRLSAVPHVEACSNTSTMVLRVVEGNKKGTHYLGV